MEVAITQMPYYKGNTVRGIVLRSIGELMQKGPLCPWEQAGQAVIAEYIRPRLVSAHFKVGEKKLTQTILAISCQLVAQNGPSTTTLKLPHWQTKLQVVKIAA